MGHLKIYFHILIILIGIHVQTRLYVLPFMLQLFHDVLPKAVPCSKGCSVEWNISDIMAGKTSVFSAISA